MSDVVYDGPKGPEIPQAVVHYQHDPSASAMIILEHEHSRSGMSADALRRGIGDHLRYSLGRPAALLEPKHYYQALSLAVRDRMQDMQGIVGAAQMGIAEAGGEVCSVPRTRDMIT